MRELEFTLLCPFGGFGLGARGFQDAEIRLPGLDVAAHWKLLGGIDVDPLACAAFEYLTGVPQLCADMRSLKPADLRKHFGKRAPHCVFTSAPCVGASGLLSAAKAATDKYQQLNDLSLVWVRLMVQAWADAPPALLLFENVPRLTARAPQMIAELRRILKRAGYVLSDAYHDCGELGGLAQRRRRWLLVARHPKRCPPVLYQPPKRRVRGCGEVLEQLPMPGTPAARAWGRMHELPRLSWLNWVRLSLIPKGGDWRDLEGVLAREQERRAVFKRHAVEDWAAPVGTVGGSGSNGVANVADPRVGYEGRDANFSVLGVQGWSDPSGAITGGAAPTRGTFSVADVRVASAPRSGAYGVQDWTEPSKTVTGVLRVDNGPAAVADPRVQVKRAFDAGYAVLDWTEAARTIAGISSVGCGAYAVADPRIDEAPPDGGVWTGDPRKAPPFVPVIIAKDGTWHRPLTTLELAALQGFPLTVDGKPLSLPGGHVAARRGIGNAVPAPAARAIGEKMLVALAEGALGAFSLSGEAVWVSPEAEACNA